MTMHRSVLRPIIFSVRTDTWSTHSNPRITLQSSHLDQTSCVVADVQMPNMSGLELLTHMRTQGRDAPFIFITAFPDESVRARALKAGAICFLGKPFTGPVLINCIETALNRHPSTDR
jgi:FixJ family two-component response regulator